MAIDPSILVNLNQLAADIDKKEHVLSDASDANDAAQTAAQAAVATASGTQAAKISAHQDVADAVDAMIKYLDTLK